ncbi:hypothetical protein [Chryseobacterium sp. HR92]|uniref:hypothetical protein n=1 Tax=Chryseobacterium sp. HR92 TaxID=3094839 RepID=UPI00388F23D4|nr:hypothetical protein SFA27_16795 [Chryseobacterium sp. HR92]
MKLEELLEEKEFYSALYGRFAPSDICPPTIIDKNNRDCFKKCESCQNEFYIKNMKQDDISNWFCPECWEELHPLMKIDFE